MHATFGSLGNLIAVTNPNGNVTSYVYDDFGQLSSQESPVTGTTAYAYDSVGNLTQMTDANGASTTRVYDALGRATTATSALVPKSEVVSWSYDSPASGRFAIGRLASMTDPSGSTTYHYDRRGLLRDETLRQGADQASPAFAGGRNAVIVASVCQDKPAVCPKGDNCRARPEQGGEGYDEPGWNPLFLFR